MREIFLERDNKRECKLKGEDKREIKLIVNAEDLLLKRKKSN